MSIEIATLIVGVLIMVGVIIAGGAIYSGLEELADAIIDRNKCFYLAQRSDNF